MNTAADVPVLTPESIRAEGVTKRFGATPVLRDVTLRVAPGTVVALLGPSGCGKTTLLRTIAGLEVPDAGTVVVGDRVLTDGRTVVPPERRRIGMVFQDWALFPHLSVGRNVAYGLGRDERRSGRVEEALALVGLDGMADRAPATLSGGQQQRVALARALAPRPTLLLLDEPFSNLDTALRVEVRTEVHRLLAELGVTTVFVTHDQEEAFVLGDEVAVMREGAIAQQAPPAELYARPADPWVAGFVGDANLVPGEPDGGGARTPVGWIPLEPDGAGSVGPLDVLIRPEELILRPDGDAEVELVEFYGHDTVYDVRLADGFRLRARVGAAPHFRRGDRVAVGYAGAPTCAWSVGTGALGAAGVSDRVPVAPG
jgi:iron(III) transport system ATP-binding protein